MSKSMNVCIVDDDHDVAESLADLLELRGHSVDLAHSGEEAVAKFRDHDYDIAFMDVRMPGMNGVESMMKIHSFKPQARVVIMTGYSVDQLLKQAAENGAVAVLYKPVKTGEILALL